MPRPTSFRLPEDLLVRIEKQAAASRTSMTALVTSILDEGLKMRQFPGIVYKDGPMGRRAALACGADIWEIVRDFKREPGTWDKRIANVAYYANQRPERIHLALDFYAAFPEEVDAMIAADAEAQVRVQEQIDRLERLLAM